MSPITHFLTSWVVANSAHLNRKDRILVTLAGILPDLDWASLPKLQPRIPQISCPGGVNITTFCVIISDSV
jgi:hypothetical protein